MVTYDIQPAAQIHYPELIQVWKESVRATHDFLSPGDIEYYKPLILELRHPPSWCKCRRRKRAKPAGRWLLPAHEV